MLISYSFFKIFHFILKNIRDILGGLKGPQGGIWGWVKFFFTKRFVFDIFGHYLAILGRQKGPQGGSQGVDEIFFSLNDAFHLDNSNVTSFSPIGRCDGKLFSFMTFLAILGGRKGHQEGGKGVGEK